MANEIYYWDSSCFIGYFGNEEDKVDLVEPLIHEAEAGTLTIVTSFMTITEVLYVEGAGVRQMSEGNRNKLKGFFRKEWIEWINFDRTIAEAARELTWDHGLKSKDAVHLASARHLIVKEKVGIDAIHSFDKDFIKMDGKLDGVECPCSKPIPTQGVLPLGVKPKKAGKKKSAQKKKSM